MDRRKSIKTLLVGSVAAGTLIEACNTDEKKPAGPAEASKGTAEADPTRMKEEIAREQELRDTKPFFTKHEMATITLLGDIIIPRDEKSGSASDAKVPDFIEFIVKDMPEHQIPMRGGLRWLDIQCLKRFDKGFTDCSQSEQIQVVDDIAYPDKAKPDMMQGVAFFSLMRNLTASGFYSSEIGVKDLGYAGNVPNKWNGVPDDVLKQYNLAYTEKEMKECASYA